MKVTELIDIIRRLRDNSTSVFFDLIAAIANYRDVDRPLWTAEGLRERVTAASAIVVQGLRLTPADPDDVLAVKIVALVNCGGEQLLIDGIAQMAGFDLGSERLAVTDEIPQDWSAIGEKISAINEHLPLPIKPSELVKITRVIAQVMQILEQDERLAAVLERGLA